MREKHSNILAGKLVAINSMYRLIREQRVTYAVEFNLKSNGTKEELRKRIHEFI